MSDEWIFFPCQMSKRRASIFFDHGVRDSIDITVAPQLLKVRVAFKRPPPDGMPTSEEFQYLTALEDGLQSLVQQHESTYVGRITFDGHRHFYIYTPDSEEAWSSRLAALGDSHGYELAFVLKPDESHDGYWQELFPTDDDWQVIQELRVLESLAKDGDDGSTSRRVDHWAYFPSEAAAHQFGQWAQEHGYALDSTNKGEDGRFCVHFAHEGTLQLPDITSHTITLQRMASELGGDYDGWETPVRKAST